MTKVFDMLTQGVTALGSGINTHALEIALIVWTFIALFVGLVLGASV